MKSCGIILFMKRIDITTYILMSDNGVCVTTFNADCCSKAVDYARAFVSGLDCVDLDIREWKTTSFNDIY